MHLMHSDTMYVTCLFYCVIMCVAYITNLHNFMNIFNYKEISQLALMRTGIYIFKLLAVPFVSLLVCSSLMSLKFPCMLK